jgi:hypothetical protein
MDAADEKMEYPSHKIEGPQQQDEDPPSTSTSTSTMYLFPTDASLS